MTIGIEIEHFKIRTIRIPDQNQAIGSDAKMTITVFLDQTVVLIREIFFTVVDDDKIIARPLIFFKLKIHGSNLGKI
jgi:hypothetical protein